MRMKRKTRRMTTAMVSGHSAGMCAHQLTLTAVAGFIDEAPEEGQAARDDFEHRRLDRAFGRNEQESVEDIVQRLKERHGRMASSRYNADSDQVPQRLLMPGVNDPSLWTVRVKVSSYTDLCGDDHELTEWCPARSRECYHRFDLSQNLQFAILRQSHRRDLRVLPRLTTRNDLCRVSTVRVRLPSDARDSRVVRLARSDSCPD